MRNKVILNSENQLVTFLKELLVDIGPEAYLLNGSREKKADRRTIVKFIKEIDGQDFKFKISADTRIHAVRRFLKLKETSNNDVLIPSQTKGGNYCLLIKGDQGTNGFYCYQA